MRLLNLNASQYDFWPILNMSMIYVHHKIMELYFQSIIQDAEKAKLTAMLQKTEMKARNLERTLGQKSKENEVRTNIMFPLFDFFLLLGINKHL